MLKGAVIVIADKSAKGEMECATDDDMLPARWLSERVSEREGPFPVQTATTTAFCEEQTCLNTPFLAQVSQLAATSTRCRGRPRIVPLSREFIKVIELMPTILLLTCFIFLKPYHI